jgi:UDP-N-acetylmuramoyl-tripeptide--D-alanyl-D-alanine ligase
MIALTLGEAARMIGAESSDDTGDRVFSGVDTDTRRIQPGALFAALKGPNFDGHDFLAGALERGAAAALVERRLDSPLPQLVVTDVLVALGRLAAGWRRRFKLPLLALTGSNGKTTVKEMLATILRQRGTVLATAGNLNNHIGVPLMLSRLGTEHDYAVIEMGANHPGEIAYLTELARPDVALITNAGPAHLEGFGSIEGVSRAKGEIYGGLAADGVAVINADDVYADYWRNLNAGRRVVDFGLERSAAVRGEVLGDSRFRLRIDDEATDIALPLPGRHNVRNALAAAAATHAVGTDLDAIRAGLEATQGVVGRLRTLSGCHGCTLVDDSYNANPASLAAGLETLVTGGRRNWLVLGDMAELGAGAETAHAEAGALARELGVECLFALGPLSLLTCRAFGAGAEHFDRVEALIDTLVAALLEADPPPRLLIKGSRSMRMERVTRALAKEGEACS